MEEKNKSQLDKDKADSKKSDGPRKKDNIVLYVTGALLLIILLLFILPRFFPDSSDLTLDKLHEKNLKGELPSEKGYVHNGIYSFVRYNNLWYTQLSTPQGTKLFNIPFHYNPKQVSDIEIVGRLNYTAFDRYRNFFITFNPIDEDLNYIATAIGETNSILIQVFGKGIIASCTTNETRACVDRPIVGCNSTDAPVLYFSSEPETNVLYLDNCMIISGNKENLLKATDRMLFDLLDIIER